MSGDVEIRRASLADADAVLDLALALARSQGDPDDILTIGDVRSRMLGPQAEMATLVACVDGVVVGYAGLLPALETAHASAGLYVSDLFVADAFRHRGIGRRLMAAAAAIARGSGGSHLWLTMLPDNHEADRFYRRIADVRAQVIAFAVTGTAFDDLADLNEDDHG